MRARAVLSPHRPPARRVQSKLLEPTKSSEKMYMIDDHVAVAVAGITADANILINQARMHAQRYRFAYQEPQPVEQLVQSLCDEKQAYTQFGGLRPFGVSMLYAGWDVTHGFQLYQSDPSGNYNGWRATCIAWITLPDPRKRHALKAACVIRWKKPAV